MTLASCIYEGRVRHRRLQNAPHEFSFPLYLMYLDLDELDEVFRDRWLWSVDRASVAAFRRQDHFGDPEQDLRDSVRDLVAERLGRRPGGPIRLLTQLRHAGFIFNPVSFYYCFQAGGEHLDAVIAEVHNTPWGERHCYVIDRTDDPEPLCGQRPTTQKTFHVSPFMDMEMAYDWRIPLPSQQLTLGIANLDREGELLFDACLSMQRRPITTGSLARLLTRYPMITVQAVVGIYWQALRLWHKGAPFHSHPGRPSEPLQITG